MAHEDWLAAHMSRAFSLDELARALGGTGAGPAGVLAAAALAPHVSARNALVLLQAEGAKHSLRLVAERALTAQEALQVWPDERLLAAARVPYLALHNIQGRKEYVCHECGAQFEDPNPLKVHLYLGCRVPQAHDFWSVVLTRLRDCEPPARPEVQLEAFAATWGRVETRTRSGAHLCLYCGKAYSRKYGLKIHIRTHTGYRPLRCRYCARAFGDPSNLNKHVRLHMHEPRARHACPQCARVLPRRRDLQRHLRSHHVPRTK